MYTSIDHLIKKSGFNWIRGLFYRPISNLRGLIRPSGRLWKGSFLPLFSLTLLVLFVCIPLYQPGFYFNLDGSFPPKIAPPNIETTGFFWVGILYTINKALPADLIQKMIYIGTLLFLSLGSYLVAPFTSRKARLFFALVMTFNPFVYSRFLAGQYAVILGYGLFVHLCIALLFTKTKPYLRLAFLFTGLYIASTHFFVLATAVILVWPFVRYINEKKFDGRLYLSFIPTILLLVVHFVFLGQNPSNMQTFSSFDRWNLGIFATIADDSKGLIFNILSLHGFWFEGENNVLTLKQTTPLWPLITLFYIGSSLYGFILFCRRQEKTQRLGAWYYGVVLVGGLMLAVGIASTTLVPFIFKLYDIFPMLYVFREPAKLIGLLAFFYAFFGAYALDHVHVSRTIGGILILCAGIYYFGFVRGFFTEISVHPYPSEWYALQAVLTREKSAKSVLFPWEMYLPLSISNGKNVFNVAEEIFPSPSTVGLTTLRVTPTKMPTTSPDEAHITGLLRIAFTRTNLFDAPIEKNIYLSDGLAEIGVDHIVLLKEFDWKLYERELGKDPGVVKVAENGKGIIYKITTASK